VAKETVAAESATPEELILDLRHTLVQVASAESDDVNRPPRLLVFRAPALSGSRPDLRAGEAPHLWFELEGRRIECQLRDAAGWQEPDGPAVALYEVPLAGGSRRSGKLAVDSAWGLRWGSDGLSGELVVETAELLIGNRSGRG
jgi:hypothetical protein